MKKLLNQFNNFCEIGRTFDLKMQDITETSNQRVYLKCGTKSILRLKIIESIQ